MSGIQLMGEYFNPFVVNRPGISMYSKLQLTSRWNLGRGRQIYLPNPSFHFTVKERIEDKALSYTPKARWQGMPVYVQ